jgi:hypothetical protein
MRELPLRHPTAFAPIGSNSAGFRRTLSAIAAVCYLCLATLPRIACATDDTRPACPGVTALVSLKVTETAPQKLEVSDIDALLTALADNQMPLPLLSAAPPAASVAIPGAAADFLLVPAEGFEPPTP